MRRVCATEQGIRPDRDRLDFGVRHLDERRELVRGRSAGADAANTAIVADPLTFAGMVADAVGIIQPDAAASDGATKADQSPAAVLGSTGAAWSSSTGPILASGTVLDVEDGTALLGAGAVTLQSGARLAPSGSVLSGPAVLQGGTLSAFGNQVLDSVGPVSGDGTVAAGNGNRQRLVLAGPVSGGALVAGDIVPARKPALSGSPTRRSSRGKPSRGPASLRRRLAALAQRRRSAGQAWPASDPSSPAPWPAAGPCLTARAGCHLRHRRASAAGHTCSTPGFDGALPSHGWKDALCDSFWMAALQRPQQPVEQPDAAKRA